MHARDGREGRGCRAVRVRLVLQPVRRRRLGRCRRRRGDEPGHAVRQDEGAGRAASSPPWRTRHSVPTYLRNATAYGASPRLRLDIVVNNLVGVAHDSGEVRLQSDGTPWRPLVHVAGHLAGRARRCSRRRASSSTTRRSTSAATRTTCRSGRSQTWWPRPCPELDVTRAAGAGPDLRDYRVDFSKLHETFPALSLGWSVKQGIDELVGAYAEHGMSADDFTSSSSPGSDGSRSCCPPGSSTTICGASPRAATATPRLGQHERPGMPAVRRGADDHVRRPRHVAALRELPRAPTSSTTPRPSTRCTCGSATGACSSSCPPTSPRRTSSATTPTSRPTPTAGWRTRSGSSTTWSPGCGLDAGSLVVEVASNDGYLLQHVVARGIPVLGDRAGREHRRRWPGSAGIRTEVTFLGRADRQGDRRPATAGGPGRRQQRLRRTSRTSSTSRAACAHWSPTTAWCRWSSRTCCG